MIFHILLPALMLAPWLQAAPPAARVDAVFKEYDSAASPGCAVAVFQDDKIVYKRAYGMANLDHDGRLSTSSVFHGSQSAWCLCRTCMRHAYRTCQAASASGHRDDDERQVVVLLRSGDPVTHCRRQGQRHVGCGRPHDAA